MSRSLSRHECTQEIIKGLFEQGLMGIETSAEHDGSEMSFMAAILAVEGTFDGSPSCVLDSFVCRGLLTETTRQHRLFSTPIELAKVDPSVSVCADVHNTLVNSTLRLYGSDYVKDKYLPGLATNVVSAP